MLISRDENLEINLSMSLVVSNLTIITTYCICIKRSYFVWSEEKALVFLRCMVISNLYVCLQTYIT